MDSSPPPRTPRPRTFTPEELVRELRTAAGGEVYGSKAKIARAMDTSAPQVDRLLAGDVDPKWSTVERMVDALGQLEGRRLSVRLVVSIAPEE